MTDPNSSTHGPLALGAALAIIRTVGNPALRDPGKDVNAGELAAIIQGELNRTVLRKAIDEAMALIEYHDGDRLGEHERNRPRGSGRARVHDKLAAARDLLEGRAA